MCIQQMEGWAQGTGAATHLARRHAQQRVRLLCQAAWRCRCVPAAPQVGPQDQSAPGGEGEGPSVMILACWACCCHPHPELGLRCPHRRLRQVSCHDQGQLGGSHPACLQQTVVALQGHHCPPAGRPQAPADWKTVSDERSWCVPSWLATCPGGRVGRRPQQAAKGPQQARPCCLLAVQKHPPDGLSHAAGVQLGQRHPSQRQRCHCAAERS